MSPLTDTDCSVATVCKGRHRWFVFDAISQVLMESRFVGFFERGFVIGVPREAVPFQEPRPDRFRVQTFEPGS